MTLYLVGTPIGNLEDISPRALETLRGVQLIAAEDTRTAKQLLAHFDIHTPVTSFYEHSKLAKLERLLETLASGDVAVISEAGMPGLSDPGYDLVRAAVARGIRVSPVPGPTAALTALVASGLPADRFYYVGFLPREPRARRKLLRSLREIPETLIVYEAPHRLRDTLQDIEDTLGPRAMCAARELTKVFEEFRRGSVIQVRAHFEQIEPRGEFTLVIAGAAKVRAGRRAPEEWDDARIRREVQKLIAHGVPRTEAVKRVARAAHRDRRTVYELASKT